MIRSAILAAVALLCATPALAQSAAPVVDGAALNGSGSAVPATSTRTGKPVKLSAELSLCASGNDYVECGNPFARSTPAIASVTSTGVTSSSGAAATFSNGQAVIPFTTDLGRPIWLKYAPSSDGVFTVQLGESTNGCASYTLLTVGGQQVSFTSLYNEYWGILPATPRTLCQIVTVSAGSLAVEARN